MRVRGAIRERERERGRGARVTRCCVWQQVITTAGATTDLGLVRHTRTGHHPGLEYSGGWKSIEDGYREKEEEEEDEEERGAR